MKLWDFYRKWECFEDLRHLEIYDETTDTIFASYEINLKLSDKEIKSFCFENGKLVIKVE